MKNRRSANGKKNAGPGRIISETRGEADQQKLEGYILEWTRKRSKEQNSARKFAGGCELRGRGENFVGGTNGKR